MRLSPRFFLPHTLFWTATLLIVLACSGPGGSGEQAGQADGRIAPLLDGMGAHRFEIGLPVQRATQQRRLLGVAYLQH